MVQRTVEGFKLAFSHVAESVAKLFADDWQRSPTPVPRLFQHCNDSPTDEEKGYIRSHILGLKDRQTKLKFEAKDTPNAPGAYSQDPNHDHRIGESIRQHRALLIGIRDMPDEILEIIFITTLQSDERRRHCELGTISLTCRRWRQAILAAPRAWAHPPSLRYPGFSWSQSEEMAFRLKTATEMYLKRSQDAPLTISLCILKPLPRDDEATVHITHTLSLLAAHSHRWHTADIHLSYGALPILPAIKGHLPLLHSLTLVLNADCDFDRAYSPFDRFSDCPNLRHVSLLFSLPDPFDAYGQLTRDPIPPLVTIPWAQLTTFRDESYNLFKRVVTKTQDGIKLDVHGGTPQDLNLQLSRLAPNAITELKLTGGGGSWEQLPEWLATGETAVFPFLQHLTFDWTTAFLWHAYRLIQRSRCTLKSLIVGAKVPGVAVEGTPEHSITVTHVLELCNELEVLRTRHPLRLSRDDYHALMQTGVDVASGESHFILLPKLRHLRIEIPLNLQPEDDHGPVARWEETDGPAFARLAKARVDGTNNVALAVELDFEWSRTSARDLLHELVVAQLPPNTMTPEGRVKPQEPALSEATLKDWYQVLKKIPQGRYMSQTPFVMQIFQRKTHNAYWAQGSEIHRVVEMLEAYPIDKLDFAEILLLQKHEIPTLLHLCLSAPASKIPCSDEYQTHDRIKALNSTWMSQISAYPAIEDAYGRWAKVVRDGDTVLRYTAKKLQSSDKKLRFEASDCDALEHAAICTLGRNQARMRHL